MKGQKATGKPNLEKQKATWAGEIRQQVETILGDRAAEREYELDAKKRLYRVIGPLRFQLLLACRDLAGRIIAHGTREPYETAIDSYYGQSMLYRILRPLALSELIERQITYADFAVDAGAVDLLRFKKNAYAVFSGSSLVDGHPAANWLGQSQHVFFDYLSTAASALIIRVGESEERCARFHEFVASLKSKAFLDACDPFPRILSDFTPAKKPLFWLRLSAYAFLCNELINRAGCQIGFEKRDFPLRNLLSASKDQIVLTKLDVYETRCKANLVSPL